MSDDIRLDPVQRHILANQYRILKHLEPNAGWDKRLEAMEWGYEIEYEFEDSATLSIETGREIYDILDMFRVIKASLRDLSAEDRKKVDESPLKFHGFDGNNETKHFSYLRHLWETNRWTELQEDAEDGGNSHFHTLGIYRARLREYKKSADNIHLTLDDLIRISKAHA